MASIAFLPAQAANRAFSGAMKAAARNVRWTVAISLALIFGSFVSAAIIQMRLDRRHALAQAAAIETRDAEEMAADFAAAFNRYAAIGAAFANARIGPETSAALAEAGGPALQNVAVLDRSGRLLSEMKRAPTDILPLAPSLLARTERGRAVASAAADRSVLLAFPSGGRIVLVQLEAAALFPAASWRDDLLATRSGRILVAGRTWRKAPASEALTLTTGKAQARTVDLASGVRLIALAPVGDWPLTAGVSIGVEEALSAWYGALPLYFFFILGPAFAGAGLAVVLVREFERRVRSRDVQRTLRAKKNEDAKLLIRLAGAERRAVEAERSKGEFIAHMSHELRTPLNAIIGFSDVIEHGLFGAPGHPKYAEYARDIGDAGRKLHAQIGDVLEFASLDAGKQPMEIAGVDAVEMARQALERIAGRAFSRKIELAPPGPDAARALADPSALKRALNNLLACVLQCTPAGGSLHVQIRCDGASVCIAVRGFGAQPFAGARRIEAPGGTRIALAIASSLARRMGGSLEFSGRQDEGATAELTLRRA